MEVKIFSISTQSANIVFISLSLRKSVALSNFSQYFVSVVSFSAMEILEIKSALLCACCASATLAPILVPERKSCFERTYSFFLSQRYLYSFTILTAKPKLLFSITFSIINYKIGAERPLIFHFPLSTFHFQFSVTSSPAKNILSPMSKPEKELSQNFRKYYSSVSSSSDEQHSQSSSSSPRELKSNSRISPHLGHEVSPQRSTSSETFISAPQVGQVTS